MCCIVSSVGFADCDAMALMGQRRVESTALPKNRNFPHTCCMNRLPFLSSGGEAGLSVTNCCFAPYSIFALGKGAFCFRVGAL